MTPGAFHNEEYVENLISRNIIKKADTIDELVSKMDTPAEATKTSIARYNELYNAGYDADFGKDPMYLSSINTPPFYACNICTALLVTGSGFKNNPKYQVYDKSEMEIIPGLYTAGNDSGGFFAKDWTGGASIGRAATSGRLAGFYAATEG